MSPVRRVVRRIRCCGKRMPYRNKLFLSYSAIVLFVTILIFAFVNYYVAGELREGEEEALMQLNAGLTEQLNFVLTDMERLSKVIATNPDVTEILIHALGDESGDNYFSKEAVERMQLNRTLLSLHGADNLNFRTLIYNDKNDFYEYLHKFDYTISNSELCGVIDSTDYYQRIMQNRGSSSLFPPQDSPWTCYGGQQFFTLARAIIDISGYRTCGIVEVQRPMEVFDELFSLSYSDDSTHVFLSDGCGRLVYPYGAAQDGAQQTLAAYLSRKGNTASGKFWIDGQGDKELVTFETTGRFDWVLFTIKKESDIFSAVLFFKRLLWGFSILVMLSSLLLIYIITNQLSRPMEQLRASLETVEFDNPSIEMPNSGGLDEIERLNEAFSIMLTRLKTSMDQVVQSKNQEAQAHMLALQSQINPHFLYNILSIISASAYESNPDKVSAICCSLAGMLRYATSYESSADSKTEFEYIRNYLALMQVRYESALHYTMEEAGDAVVLPKLLFQPMVENCFQHAFQNQEPPWEIRIRFECDESRWQFEIHDNGCGFAPQVAQSLEQQADEFLKNPEQEIKKLRIGGLGLLNTLIRLRLRYGQDFLFKIENLEHGARVTIGGPVQMREAGAGA